MLLALLAALIGITGACTGAFLPVAHGRARVFVPLSGAVLLAVSLFSILPETAGKSGWLRTIILYEAGYGLLFLVDRYVHPVCPSCSHSHDHGHCEVELHGFSVPLLIATSVHSFIDGWSMTIAQMATGGSMRTTIPVAVLLHKIPEGLALGVMLRASFKSRMAAAGWGAAAESFTVAGAVVALTLSPGMWASDLLAVAGGTFLYLGLHAVHGALGWNFLPQRR
jgi:zinc transporter ZupT